ncbi:VOC family protein [Micromonospora sp. HM5-17]|uniref:VOC family protein n=1 Tax=Micromonospora sp. HM5-17 TaxID=2487710 RepID=UPI000F46402A|nr:VOC family protein [Micromonospora sp. HM5-17]ROT27056.1 VOC family protein [Micromonospora sp. HM5-17]
MADDRRRQVAPVRKLVAAVLGTLATFVTLFGVGMRSWAIAMLGVALLALAVGLVAITAVRTGPRAWVTGVGHVHSVTEPPASSAFGRCELQIVIDAPGVPARSVKIRDPRVPVSKWPDPGATLPIMVAIDDQRHVRILWDEVLTHAEAAASGDLPPPFEGPDPLGDDILIEQEAPPWARRERDDPFAGPPVAETVPDDPVDDPDRFREDPEPFRDERDDDRGAPRDEPVVVRQTPGGTIVLEGTLVEAPATPPLPRRPRPAPTSEARRPSPGPAAETAAPAVSTVVTEPTPPDTSGREPTAAAPTPPAPRAGTPDSEIDIALDNPASDADVEPAADPTLTSDDEAILANLRATPPPARLGESGPIAGVGITLLVTDLERSVSFYRDLLGFFEIDGGNGNAVLASGATRLVLRAIPEVAPINRRLVHLNLEVNDVNATYEELVAKGVKFTYPPRAVNRGAKLELWAAAFRDPDGHGIALTQWRERDPD